MSSSIRDIFRRVLDIFRRVLARIGATVGVRRAADTAGALSKAEELCDIGSIDRMIENLGSASEPERAVGELVAVGEPALRRLLDVFNLPEFESATSRPPPSEPQFAVDPAEIDRWIEQLGSGGESAIEKVVSFGEPALRRLFELAYGDASVPMGKYLKDAFDGRFNALARLTKRYPDLAIELVRGRPNIPLPVVAAFRTWGDERLKMIADIASKNDMRVSGLTS